MRLTVSFLIVGQRQGLSLSHEAPLSVAHQAPLFRGFSRREYAGLGSHFSRALLSNPGTEPRSPVLQVESLLPEPPRQIIIGMCPYLKMHNRNKDNVTKRLVSLFVNLETTQND